MKTKKAASKAKNSEDRAKLLAEVSELTANMPETIYASQIFLDDATPEGIAFELSKHTALSIIEAEGKILDILSGMYGEIASFDVFLKAYGAEPIRVTRRNALPISVTTPRLTWCLAIQPHVLKTLKQVEPSGGRDLTAGQTTSCLQAKLVFTPLRQTQCRNT